MMAHASAMTYTPTPSVSSGGKNATDTETDSSTHQSCENELLALDIPGGGSGGENGTTNRNTSNNKRSYYDRAYLTFPGDSESPKKRRKQSTPVKIPTTNLENPESEQAQAQVNANANNSTATSQEGKLETHNSSSSPALANSSTPSPDVFKATGDEGPSQGASPTTSNPPLVQNMHSDLFKIDFGAPSWLPDIQNKAPEDWLGTPPPLHNVPFSFPSSSLQSPVLPGQVVTQFPTNMMDQQSGGSGGVNSHGLLTRPLSQGPRIRIFNPDAYCELCNKEFCNKYFLKTHKANKHGIYTDLQPNELQYQTSGLPGSGPNTPGPCNPSASASASASVSGTTTSATACIVTANNNHTNSIKPLTLPQSIPELPAKVGSESTSSPKIASNLLTASCDICQKKFCNKQLVKRHKVKVHGIIDDSQSNNDDNSNLDPNISDSNSETPVQMQSPNSSNNYYQEGLPECLKPFLETDFDSDNLQQYRWQQSNVSQQVREAIHRPRGLGIINPEAFCEICCKEYCNKYFLRTHKLKRHGIAIPDDPPTPREGNSAPTTITSASDNTRTVQTSPLNLIKSEQTTSSSESYSDKKDSEIMMCGICGVHVAQKYMKAHYEACHIAKNPSDNNPTASTATSSPMSTSGRQLDLNDELNNSETASNDKPPTEENINEDLKKLQTMILQLNNLNVCQIVSCNVCCKEFENKFYLQAHMMSDHGQLYMKITDEKISIQNTTNIITTQNSNESVSTVVPTASIKVVPSESLTSSKMFPSNSDIPSTERLTPSDNYNPQTSSRNTTPTIQAPVERRSSISLAPTNSYCEICNKELCNKYFMKTHMQRMHGIEIENGAQIGGVVCNICNKELCSKYFLRVHKHNTHGIVEDGMPLPQSRQTNEDSSQPPPTTSTSGGTMPPTNTATIPPTSVSAPPIEAPTQFQVQPIPPPSDASLKPNELGDLNHRYFAHFTEVCPICSRRFRSTKWLKAHLVTDHGKSEHDKWEELEILYQKQAAKMSDPTNFKLHDEIKVPNGGGPASGGLLEHESMADKVGIQNLISNIFGQDELHSKKYYCSFCNFSTPVLAFLFVHERSHGQPPHTNIYQCPICTQSYQTGEQLQQHLIVQHSNITSQKLFKTTVSSSSNVTPTPPDNCSNTSMPANNNNAETDTKPDDTDTNTNGNDIKPKIYDLRRIFHTDNLVEMAQQMQIPTTYALPQGHETKNLTDDDDIVDKKYMMQPFLIEEYHEKTTTMGIQLRLVPSLVFLPVRERVTSPLTTSIKFTPT